MPIITFEGGKLTTEQKRELIKRFTEVATEVTNIPDKFYSVTIRELSEENLGVGGQTVADMKANMNK
jgi:4-oxalocrotonate tautomerase